MKKFFVRISITLFFLLGTACLVDRFVTHNLHQSNARLFQSWNDIYFKGLQCDAVIMGSSRGWIQYSPRIIDSIVGTNSYNLGVDGRSIDAEIIKYKIYTQHNPIPKLIIQNVDWNTLNLSNGYEREQFLPYLFDDSLFSMTKASEGFSYADKYIPLIRYAGYLQVIKEGLHLPTKLPKPILYKGYAGSCAEWNGDQFSKIEKIGFAHDPTAVSLFEQYLANCQKDNIQIIFVFAPIYIGVTNKMQNPQQMFDFYNAIASKYHCAVLNYTYHPLSYDTTYFYNATHLNKKGSEIFSTQLANDIDSLLQNNIITLTQQN